MEPVKAAIQPAITADVRTTSDKRGIGFGLGTRVQFDYPCLAFLLVTTWLTENGRREHHNEG